MKPINLPFRFFIIFTMILSFFHPSLQLTAASTLSDQETATLAGSLVNGEHFSLVTAPNLKGCAWIKLKHEMPADSRMKCTFLLTEQASFYGTERLNRKKLASKLNNLGLDIDADSYLQMTEEGPSFQLSLAEGSLEHLKEVLEIIQQLTFSPTLTTENVEMAREHLLKSLDLSLEEREAIESLTSDEVRAFHAQWYQPDLIELTIVSHNPTNELPLVISKAFGSEVESDQAISSFADSFLNKVEWTVDHDSLVVDGKIWMKEPIWINKSINGRTLGGLLTVLGISGMVLAFSLSPPVAIVAGGLSAASGVYFLTASYLKDPNYIESVRKTDLEYGMTYAYQKGRAGITMTPYERRASLLQELVDRPQKLPKLPILLLADLYQLSDPIFSEIFTVDEFNVISRLKRDFIQQRNQWKIMVEAIEKELTTLSAPYVLSRDAALLNAQDVFNQNYYVLARANLKAQRDASIAEIEKSYKENEISLKERDSMIQQAHVSYEACLAAPDFKAGLVSAEMQQAKMELEIKATYTYQVEICKQSIQYTQRMEHLNQGDKSLIAYFNTELRNLLATFPVYYPPCPDFIDLRNL